MNLSNSNRKWLPILTIINNNRVKNFNLLNRCITECERTLEKEINQQLSASGSVKIVEQSPWLCLQQIIVNQYLAVKLGWIYEYVVSLVLILQHLIELYSYFELIDVTGQFLMTVESSLNERNGLV